MGINISEIGIHNIRIITRYINCTTTTSISGVNGITNFKPGCFNCSINTFNKDGTTIFCRNTISEVRTNDFCIGSVNQYGTTMS